MNTFDEQHPRATSGKFTDKGQSAPAVRLGAPPTPVDIGFFWRDRTTREIWETDTQGGIPTYSGITETENYNGRPKTCRLPDGRKFISTGLTGDQDGLNKLMAKDIEARRKDNPRLQVGDYSVTASNAEEAVERFENRYLNGDVAIINGVLWRDSDIL